MSSTRIIECFLTFNFKHKQERCTCSFPKGAKILKNNSDPNPLKIFAFFEGIPNGHQDQITFFLVKQDKHITEVTKEIKLEASEHLRTFTNEHGTWHLFKLNHE